MRKNYKISLRYALATLVSFAFTQGALAQTEGLVVGGLLKGGKTYTVTESMTLTATSGNGLNVDPSTSNGNPAILNIPSGVTLTVNGANANGMTGGGAGISVPVGAELIIKGDGTLIATGGNAASGGDGQNGENGNKATGTYADKNSNWNEIKEAPKYVGAGGAGGYGGGGAGAGIGGAGGSGGAGGAGGAGFEYKSDYTGYGNPGNEGKNGYPGEAMGKLYIIGNVNVTATAGGNGEKGGAGGSQGYSVYYSTAPVVGHWYIAGAGGGGAGGGAGYAAPKGIGAGGRGGGGGAGAGSGTTENVSKTVNFGGLATPTHSNAFGNGQSATAVGIGSANGNKGINHPDNDNGYDKGGVGIDGANINVIDLYYTNRGGLAGTNAGSAGRVADANEKGSLYVASSAKLTNTTFDGSTDGNVIVSTDNSTTLVPTVNDALICAKAADDETANIMLQTDANVGSTTLTNPGKAVTLDLNGKGLLVDGAAGDITGNANVTILLKDGNNHAKEYGTDNVPYANLSAISGSPIKYTRKISSVQSGNWQSLYLPFEAKRPDNTKIGVINKVEIDNTSAKLWIEKLDGDKNLTAFTPYFIQHEEGEFEIEAATTALAAYKIDDPVSIEGCNYTIAGSLKSTDRVSGAEKNFWSMTNGGGFSWVKVGVGQRPYRWVIYGDPQDATNAAGKVMTLFVMESDDTTTGVQDIKIADSNDVYTISGMKLSNNAKLSKGLYISNGKKFYVK